MKKLVIIVLVFGSICVNAITLKCKQKGEYNAHALIIEDVGDEVFMGNKRISCYNKKDPTQVTGMLIRGLGPGLRITANESFIVKCPKVKSVDDLIYFQNGFFGGKFSFGMIAGASVGIFNSGKDDDSGTCYVFGLSFQSLGVGITGGGLSFWIEDLY